MLTLRLTLEEARELQRLLAEHRYYGWIYQVGEFGVEASGRVSPILEALDGKLKEALKQIQHLKPQAA